MKRSTLAACAIAIALSAGLVPEGAQADTVLSRWCWQMLPSGKEMNAVLKIVVTNSGAVELHSDFFDGGSLVSELREAEGGVFENVDSPSGDKYRIVRNTGNLQLIDDQGLIDTAQRLDNNAGNDDCLR
ncbi:MAG: hypothetical protein RH942_03795 [Kiloniellaceae bacterium]